jgi:hypothetical protein
MRIILVSLTLLLAGCALDRPYDRREALCYSSPDGVYQCVGPFGPPVGPSPQGSFTEPRH